jgi:hypothetical protein
MYSWSENQKNDFEYSDSYRRNLGVRTMGANAPLQYFLYLRNFLATELKRGK